MKTNLIKFLPSYVGSKAYWIKDLQEFKNENFVELFCGSSVISANLAKTAILNDIDSIVYKIMANFDKLIVLETFTKEDYMKYRKDIEWWKYIYCLQKMSFSGVFRYSKNGFNVPMKKDFNLKNINVKPEYDLALVRWTELSPKCLNLSYIDIPKEFLIGKTIVIDPPYQNSQASYNTIFDYTIYWDYINEIKKIAKTIILFDREYNFKKQNISAVSSRKMRVNGAKQGDTEVMGIYENDKWRN